jgi:hypothetical protein
VPDGLSIQFTTTTGRNRGQQAVFQQLAVAGQLAHCEAPGNYEATRNDNGQTIRQSARFDSRLASTDCLAINLL